MMISNNSEAQECAPPISSIKAELLFVDEADVFDPTDSKYKAVLSSFPPDKESTWPYPKDRDIWVHSHNAIRGELKFIEECLQALIKRKRPLESWEVKALIKIYDAHDHFIYEHHTNEDGVMKPALAKRVNTPHFPHGYDDHEALVQRMENLGNHIHDLKPDQDMQAALASILSEFQAYSSHMLDHLNEEEQFGLPLMRAYFAPKDIANVVKLINKNTSQMELGCIIYHMGEKRFRSEYMKQEGIPFLMWHTKYQGALKLFETSIVRLVEAIKAGVEPATRKSGIFGKQ